MRLDWLGSDALTWRDLLVVVHQSPRDSAIIRELDPSSQHTHELEMLRRIEYWAHWLGWSKTADGAKGRKVPAPHRFPWEPKPDPAFAADPLPIEVMAARLGWPAPKVVTDGADRG